MSTQRRFVYGLAGLCTIFSLAAAAIAIDGLTDSARSSDVIVVLGNEVLSDGTASPRLAARLDAAHLAYHEGLASRIIVSGGVGESGYDEATIMAAYLVAVGIEPEAIVVDSKGTTTRATANNTALIMNENGWTSAIIATQFYHISRSRLAFQQAGIAHVTAVHADYWELRDLYSLAREIPAWASYRLGRS